MVPPSPILLADSFPGEDMLDTPQSRNPEASHPHQLGPAHVLPASMPLNFARDGTLGEVQDIGTNENGSV